MVRLLKEKNVDIEVKHEGILEVPEGKNVDDLPMSHFEKLVKKKGLSKITKALNNLQVWNKNDDKKLSKWAGDMIDKLNKKYGKKESLRLRESTRPFETIEDAARYYFDNWYNGFVTNDEIRRNLRRNGYSDDFISDVFEFISELSDEADEYWDDLDESSKRVGVCELARPRKSWNAISKLKESYSEDDWWSSIPKDLWDVVAEMESLGWEAVGYVDMGVDYCISTKSATRPELSFEMCVHITSPEFSADNTSISVGKWIEVYDWNNDKNLPDIPNESGVYEFRTPQDVRKFTQWFKRLGASY